MIPLLAYFSLRTVTRRGDSRAFLFMMGAFALPLALVPTLPALAGERGEAIAAVLFFPFFPLGFALLCASYGYGLGRAGAPARPQRQPPGADEIVFGYGLLRAYLLVAGVICPAGAAALALLLKDRPSGLPVLLGICGAGAKITVDKQLSRYRQFYDLLRKYAPQPAWETLTLPLRCRARLLLPGVLCLLGLGWIAFMAWAYNYSPPRTPGDRASFIFLTTLGGTLPRTWTEWRRRLRCTSSSSALRMGAS